MLEINKMLTISTAHIKPSTAKMLDEEANVGELGLTVYPKGPAEAPFGYFIYINPDESVSQTLPEELSNALVFATEHGCNILCLDGDGEIIEELPTFDWADEPYKPMDEYKVSQLERMLAHETDPAETHYGAHLNHWYGDSAPLTIDAGGLKALRDYYKTHYTNLD